MKRSAICLFLSAAVVGWAATSHARRGGGKTAAPAADAADDAKSDDSEKAAAPAAAGAGEGQAGGEAAPASESLTEDENQGGKVEEELGGPKGARPSATLSWKDIVVVPRKAFIKGGRVELAPFSGITVNDNLIRHYVFGVDLNYFLTDVFWIGLEGQYFVKQLTTEEELVGLQYNRTSSLNRFLYGGALNFGYVPVYGKFALFNRQILHWEIWASAGAGVTITEVIPRDPANQSKVFKNTDLTPNVGLGSRFFLTDWLTVNFAIRDYITPDKFEPNPNPVNQPPNGAPFYPDAATAKANAESALVNNIVVSVGVGFYLPTKFQYKTPR
jgi:outer membrane beta-barrel protein